MGLGVGSFATTLFEDVCSFAWFGFEYHVVGRASSGGEFVGRALRLTYSRRYSAVLFLL